MTIIWIAPVIVGIGLLVLTWLALRNTEPEGVVMNAARRRSLEIARRKADERMQREAR